MFGIHQRQDGVQQVTFGDLFVHKKRLRHRPRVGQAGGFDDHPLEVQQTLAFLGRQQLQRFTQILPDGAADAAVAHLHDLLLRLGDQNVVVNILFTKFVLNHGDLLAVPFAQHPFEQGGFTRAQEAREDGDRDQTHEEDSGKLEARECRGDLEHLV